MSDNIINVEVLATPNIVVNANNGYVGLDGLSAYEVAVKNGFEGTEQEWIDSLSYYKIETYNTIDDFPSKGSSNYLYLTKENKLYRWDKDNSKYYCVGNDAGSIYLNNGVGEDNISLYPLFSTTGQSGYQTPCITNGITVNSLTKNVAIEHGLSIGEGLNVVGNILTSSGTVTASTFVGKLQGNADSSTNDDKGNNISSTYATKDELIKTNNNVSLKAPITNPEFIGVPMAPTAGIGTNTTQIATTAFVQSQITSDIATTTESEDGTNDFKIMTPIKVFQAISAWITNKIATTEQSLAGNDDTSLMTPAKTKSAIDDRQYAPLASPALTGTPTAPTAAASTNSGQLATTAFVQTVVALAIAGALKYRTTWSSTSQTDFSSISLPVKAGYMYLVTGTGCMINAVEYKAGDYLVINTDVAEGGTIAASYVDKIDNTEAADIVRLEATQTLTNKTLAAPTITGDATAVTQAEGDNSTKLSTTAYADRVARRWRAGSTYRLGEVIYSPNMPAGCVAMVTAVTSGSTGVVSTTEPDWGKNAGVSITDGKLTWNIMRYHFLYDENLTTGYRVFKYFDPNTGTIKNDIHEWGTYYTLNHGTWENLDLPLTCTSVISVIGSCGNSENYVGTALNNASSILFSGHVNNSRIYWKISGN